jgi:hypothetical protein
MNSIGFTLFQFALRLCLVCWLAGSLFAQTGPAEPGLVAHEWGTFTSIAGSDGRAVTWRSWAPTVPDDLPSFVEQLHWGFKEGLQGTVRMETPVLYFYSQRDVNVSVRVGFMKGTITEWYPRADEPVRDSSVTDANLRFQRGENGGIFWKNVAIEPASHPEFPQDFSVQPKLVGNYAAGPGNRYYAARQTSSAPLRVRTASADQHEKFLFYRGVAGFDVPLAAQFNAQNKLLIKNSFEDPVSSVIWFERRGDQVGYRVVQEIESETVLESPELSARLEHLYGDLEEILVARGLYRSEAHAMIETWRDSWFEEGNRLLYIVPSRFVNSMLPLAITPAPEHVTRVFVGRMELVSPAMRQEFAAALAAKDYQPLTKYGRFLSPIMDMIKSTNPQQSQSKQPLNTPCTIEPTVAADQRR